MTQNMKEHGDVMEMKEGQYVWSKELGQNLQRQVDKVIQDLLCFSKAFILGAGNCHGNVDHS